MMRKRRPRNDEQKRAAELPGGDDPAMTRRGARDGKAKKAFRPGPSLRAKRSNPRGWILFELIKRRFLR